MVTTDEIKRFHVRQIDARLLYRSREIVDESSTYVGIEHLPKRWKIYMNTIEDHGDDLRVWTMYPEIDSAYAEKWMTHSTQEKTRISYALASYIYKTWIALSITHQCKGSEWGIFFSPFETTKGGKNTIIGVPGGSMVKYSDDRKGDPKEEEIMIRFSKNAVLFIQYIDQLLWKYITGIQENEDQTFQLQLISMKNIGYL